VERCYRVYSLSEHGSITGAENREFDSDGQALAHARDLLRASPAVEVWQTHRLVHRLVRDDPAAPSDEDRPPLALVGLALEGMGDSEKGRSVLGGQAAAMAEKDLPLVVGEITQAWRLGLLRTDEATRRLGEVLGEDSREIDQRIAAARGAVGRAGLHNPMQPFVLRSNIRRFERLLADPLAPVARRTVEALLSSARRELALIEARQSGALEPTASPRFDGAAARRGLLDSLEGVTRPIMLLSPQPGLHILDVNDAFADVARVARGKAAGERLFDVFPDNPDNAEANGVSNLYASLRRVVQTGRPDVMGLQRYDIRDDDAWVERYWMPVNAPVFDDSGRLIHIVHRSEDVTRHVHALAF
jgi:hypothetical protein